MSFKNAFKLLISKFSYVWVILLYITVMFVILLSLGLTFLLPVIRSFAAAGIGVLAFFLVKKIRRNLRLKNGE